MSDDRTRPRRTGVETGLRTAAVWAAVHGVVATRAADLDRPLHVVDLGGGTGGLAVPLAVAGHRVTVVDPSPDALASLRRRAAEEGVEDAVTARQGDADTLADVVDQPVDLLCCHGILELVDDPAAALAGLARALPRGAVLSLVTAQRLAAVWARALAGQFAAAAAILHSPDGRGGDTDSLRHRFDPEALTALVEEAGFTVTDAHGIRLFSDLVPSTTVDTEAERIALLDLEAHAAAHPDGDLLGRFGTSVHLLAVRSASAR